MTPGTGVTRTCQAPGCNTSLEGMRASAVYCSASCRTRGWKDKKGITGYRAVKASRNGRRRGGLQVSYRKAVDQLARYLPTVAPLAPGGAVEEAERILRPALPPSAAVHLEREAA